MGVSLKSFYGEVLISDKELIKIVKMIISLPTTNYKLREVVSGLYHLVNALLEKIPLVALTKTEVFCLKSAALLTNAWAELIKCGNLMNDLISIIKSKLKLLSADPDVYIAFIFDLIFPFKKCAQNLRALESKWTTVFGPSWNKGYLFQMINNPTNNFDVNFLNTINFYSLGLHGILMFDSEIIFTSIKFDSNHRLVYSNSILEPILTNIFKCKESKLFDKIISHQKTQAIMSMSSPSFSPCFLGMFELELNSFTRVEFMILSPTQTIKNKCEMLEHVQNNMHPAFNNYELDVLSLEAHVFDLFYFNDDGCKYNLCVANTDETFVLLKLNFARICPRIIVPLKICFKLSVLKYFSTINN